MLIETLLATWQTFYMIVVATCIASLIGIPLGIWLEVSKKGHILANGYYYHVLNMVINVGRSIPFIILMIAMIPFTQWVVGTSIGTTAAIVPLTISAIPFIARLTETALMEVPAGLIEMGIAMGANPWQIISQILLPEAWPSIIKGITLTLVALVGYSAMAGAIGGGGLGDLAIRYGYQRFETHVMIITIIILIFLVQVLQFIGDRIANQLNTKN